jgi:ankyrin repeat protein
VVVIAIHSTNQMSFNESVFFSSIESGDIQTFSNQLQLCGSNLNIISQEDQWTPLTAACYFRDREAFITLLIDKNADVNFANDLGEFALYVAAERNNVKAVQQLLLKQADVDKQYSGLGKLYFDIHRNNKTTTK